MRRWRDWLTVVCTPGYWIQSEPYSEAWDRELTWLMDSGFRFQIIDGYRARIGDTYVWIANHPYASFTPDRVRTARPVVRPRRATIVRAHRQMVADAFPTVAPDASGLRKVQK